MGLVGPLLGSSVVRHSIRESGSYSKVKPVSLFQSSQLQLSQEEHTTGSDWVQPAVPIAGASPARQSYWVLGGQIKIVSCWGWCHPSLPEWCRYFTTSLFHNDTTQCPSESQSEPSRETHFKDPSSEQHSLPSQPYGTELIKAGLPGLGRTDQNSLYLG